MKTFETPFVEVMEFDVADALTTSAPTESSYEPGPM